MSGGVDSSVAACLLHEQGYEVIGAFMRMGSAPEPQEPGRVRLPVHSGADKHRGCCSAEDSTDARVVAGKLGIPFYALNFEEDFSRLIDYFADEYAAARTPNPCVRCNSWLKFGRLIEYADAVEADWIATGHYARIDQNPDRPRLFCARDSRKDQSYVLFGVPLPALRRTLFPLGNLTKSEVRAHARRFDLSLHDKPESQDICFVPDRDYARVVHSRRPDSQVTGRIRHVDGRDLGSHSGVANFTIGQRRGVGVAVGAPIYVSRLDTSSATVTVGPLEALMGDQVNASAISWLSEVPNTPFKAQVRIRYNHHAAPAWVTPIASDRVAVRFDEPQFAITPGQALVIYNNDEVLGGGWIDSP